MQLYIPQPAYKLYPFDRGWRIIRYISTNLFKQTNLAARWWFDKADDLKRTVATKNWFIKYWAYIAMGGLYIAGATQYLSAMALVALFIALQTVILSIWAFLSALLIGFLTACTFLYARLFRIFYRCPDCHKDMPIPTFVCPGCHTEHTRLWPSIYGIIAHRCNVCETRLAALGWFGRKKVTRICPSCKRPLNLGVGEGTNLHIPMVGGTSTGKTNYIVMATREFIRIYQGMRYNVTFTDTNHENNYNANVARLSSGHELLKTPDIVPQAYNLRIKGPLAPVPTIAYVYDASGEAFNASDNTNIQEYYKYIDGIVFVIDPFAIPAYRRAHQGDIEPIKDLVRPSSLDVMQAYERMRQMFEASVGFQKGRRYPHPIAVVVTKVDALDLEYEIGVPAARTLLAQDASIKSEQDAMSQVVRNFLNTYGLDHLVREMELQFSNVRYFSCSALGRLPLPNDTQAFEPIRAADPLVWLLAKTRAIKPLPKTKVQSGQTLELEQPMMMQQSV